ncbi:MAG TPA: cation:proton antiporter [Flavobacteriales bacterium]
MDRFLASDHYIVLLLFLGLVFLSAAVLPRLLRNVFVSMPLVHIAFGALLGWLTSGRFVADPVEHGTWVERLAEMAVIISLMSAGLKLDRPIGLARWASTWRLLIITMPLCIALLVVGGHWLLGLPLAAAVLLGAVLAPTDPVLASDVQVGPPGEGGEDEARFALTSEAGLNDGLAFPFVNLALVLAATGLAGAGLGEWLLVDVLWKIVAGTGMGIAIGHVVAKLVFRFRAWDAISDGFVAIALTFVAYAATELVHGYGFLAVFAAAVMFRRNERNKVDHKELHDFSEQVERMLMSVLLILFGMALVHGLLDPLGWKGLVLGSFFLLVARPVAGWLGLIGTTMPGRFRAVIAVYGIRGIGTFYYLAYGLNHTELADGTAREVWAVAAWVVLLSVLLHGTTANFVLERVDRAAGR